MPDPIEPEDLSIRRALRRKFVEDPTDFAFALFMMALATILFLVIIFVGLTEAWNFFFGQQCPAE